MPQHRNPLSVYISSELYANNIDSQKKNRKNFCMCVHMCTYLHDNRKEQRIGQKEDEREKKSSKTFYC